MEKRMPVGGKVCPTVKYGALDPDLDDTSSVTSYY